MNISKLKEQMLEALAEVQQRYPDIVKDIPPGLRDAIIALPHLAQLKAVLPETAKATIDEWIERWRST